MKKSKDYNISDKDKKIIDAFLEKYQNNQYFLDSLFNDMDSDDILEYVDERDCYHEFGDDLLDEFEDYELINYLEKEGYNVSDRKIEDESLVDMIYSICNILSPRRYLTKEDKKKEICDFIDFWFC